MKDKKTIPVTVHYVEYRLRQVSNRWTYVVYVNGKIFCYTENWPYISPTDCLNMAIKHYNELINDKNS